MSHHRKHNSRVSQISLKYFLKSRCVSDLSIVHVTNSLFNREESFEVDLGIVGQNSFFNCLNFIIQQLNFISTGFIDSLI